MEVRGRDHVDLAYELKDLGRPKAQAIQGSPNAQGDAGETVFSWLAIRHAGLNEQRSTLATCTVAFRDNGI